MVSHSDHRAHNKETKNPRFYSDIDSNYIYICISTSFSNCIIMYFPDGLIDCADPECCSNHICRSSQLCVSAPKPIDILLRKQPPAITASFFERMKFLIDEGSLQNYARQETFNERWVKRLPARLVVGSLLRPPRLALLLNYDSNYDVIIAPIAFTTLSVEKRNA